MSHLSPETLEHYVMGALDSAAAEQVEAHTSACESCAAALQREARVEVGLLEVAALPVPLSSVRRRMRFAATVSALAAAATAVLVVGSTLETHEQPQPAPRVARCDASGAARDCLAQAQFDGVLTIGPDQQVVVPRYDAVSP